MSTKHLPFDGMVIAVTGGASGIGAACVQLLSERGATVAVMDINVALAEKTAELTGGTAFQLDVTSQDSIAAAIATVESQLGPIDGAVTSAGIVQPPLPPEELPIELYDRVYAINQRGTYLCLCEFARRMLPRRAGSLVTISSVTARRSVPLHAYAPAKAAVSNMTASLAGEWGRAGLRVNSIEPGYTRTPALQDQIDQGLRDTALLNENSTLGRMIEPVEVAKAAAFLLSDEASAVTGISMAVDAGFYCAGSWAPYGGVRQR